MATFEQAMLARDRTFAIRVGKYQSNDIKEASFDYGYIKGDTFKPGGTCAGSAKVTFTSIITTFKKLDKVYPEIGLLVGNAYEWVKMGEYFINDIEIDRNRNLTTLDLMDGMFKFNKPFETVLSYPAQIRDVIREICAKTGVTLQTDNLGLRAIQHHIQKKPDKKDITYREVLSQAVQLLGFSAFFNREGKLEIRGLTESNITITADSYFLHGLTKSEIEYQIAGITCKVKDKEVLTVGLRTGRSLELENSFMNQNILDALYYDLKNLKYYPFNLNYQGHLKLQVGQWVTIKTNKNETFKVPVLNQSFKFQGGLSARISADSKAGNDAQYSYGGFYAKRIEQANTDMAAEVQQQLEYAESEFNKQTEKFKGEVKAGIDKAKNESQAYADRLNQAVTNKVQEVNQLVIANRAEQDKQYKETLAKASASSDLAKQAQNLATQVRDDLNKVKQTATQAQSQVNSQIEQVKQDVGAIRTQQTTYEQSNEQNLSRITGQLADKASKSEVKQTADGIREEISQISVGGTNLVRNGAINLGNDSYWGGTIGKWSTNRTHEFYKNGKEPMFVIDTSEPNIAYIQNMVFNKLEKNTTYTLSFVGFMSWNVSNFRVLVGLLSDTDQNWKEALQVYNKRLPSAGAQRVVVQFNSGNYDGFSIRFDNMGSSNGQSAHVWISEVKVEKGTIATDWSPAPEDVDEQITVAKTTFEKTAEGLKTDMVAVKSYVANDGKRREELEQYTRTETARNTEALRKQVSEEYVAKSQYSEDVRGITRKFEELRVGGTNLFKGSRNFDKELWDYNPYKNAPISERVDDMAVISADYLWAGLSQLIKAKAGETYTFSFWALSNKDNDQVSIYIPLNDWITKPKATVDAGSKTIVINKAWSRISFTFKVLSDGFIAPRLERFDANGILKYRGFKLERGTISSDWSPAPADGEKYAETKLAEYKQGVDGRFATITSQLNNKVNQTDFQKVQETTKLYERIIGSTENDVASKVSKMVMSNSLFQVEVSKNEGLKTVQTQLAGSWAVKNINSAGDLISGLNLGANGVNRLDGRLTHITGQTLIDNAVIKSAMIDKLKTANFESGSVTTQILASGAVTADKLVVDQAFFNKLSANYAYLRQLFSKDAFITSVQSVTMSASKIVGGTLAAINGNMHIDLNNGQIHYYTDQAALKRFLSGYPTQFIKFATGNVEGGTTAGVTVIGSNRYGTESSDDGGFVGIRAWNGNGNDSVDVVGDTVRLASSAYENADGWVVSTTGKLQIRPRREQDRRESTINVGDVWLFLDNSGYYTSLHNVLRRLSNSIGALYDYRAQNGEGTPAWWDTRSSVGRL
ncbi:gp58-like family protein [Streptococcus constellatus]|uniref:gp58-like family protein n=1 Tax=Streptococcus constellatus TaxID=76860 RepID=UPI002105937B|nr:gp58-like family protein [Streptococcus constellatus]